MTYTEKDEESSPRTGIEIQSIGFKFAFDKFLRLRLKQYHEMLQYRLFCVSAAIIQSVFPLF